MLCYTALLFATWFLWKVVRRMFTPKSQIDNLPGPASPSWIVGHLMKIYDTNSWDFHRELLKYGPVFRLQAMLGQPMLCVYDPTALHSIVLKDQHVFEEMGWFLNLTFDSFGPGLLSTTGETHRKQRKLLNPVFSSKNLQRLTPVFYEVIHRLTKGIAVQVSSTTEEVDMANYLGRAALELIGQATIGHSFDPLTEARHDAYTEALKNFLPALNRLSGYFMLYRVLRPIIPAFLRRPLMDVLPSRRVKRLLWCIDTMEENALNIFMEKKRATEAHGHGIPKTGPLPTDARDLMTILLHANAEASAEDALPEEELISQLSTLLFAATDTTSNALTMILHRLAERLDVQSKLHDEIVEAKRLHDHGDLPYDELLALPYLDAVCRETLRLHPIAPLRFREARADAILPLSKPVIGSDGATMHSIFVPKGTLVFVPLHAPNLNVELWGADAHQWRPERWLEPLPDALVAAKIPGVYSNLMTFWGGGRSCIGLKFAQVEMKVALAELLAAFKFELTDKPVRWNVSEVIHPTVGTESTRTEFPMKVTRL